MKKKISIFLPCRKGSQRVPLKNTRPFADEEKGLIFLKLKELIKLENIEEIVVSTDDEIVLEIAKSVNSSLIRLDNRPPELASSETSTDDLIKYVPTIISNEHIMWTHVTSPFIKQSTYSSAIQTYFKNIEYDSLMSVTELKTFLWNNAGPVNYNREIEKWPRTQTIESLFEINSAFFIASRDRYINFKDRIGLNPQLFKLNKIESYDIDWEEDFLIAETIYEKNKKYPMGL